MIWRVNREQLLLLSGGRAVLLQEAHPFVAQGVDQHSLTKADPVGRYVRTFKHVHAMIFGDLESAMSSARRVHKFHTTVRGHMSEPTGPYPRGAPYEANDERALLWVHATIWESSVLAYELMFEPLSADEKERYYQETKLFAYLFGIPDTLIPPSWPDFVAYNRQMWDSSELAVEHAARSMATFVLSPTNPIHARFSGAIRVLTAGLLPASLREAYGLRFGQTERALYEAALVTIRAARHVLHPAQRFVLAYLTARARVGDPIVPTRLERVGGRILASGMSRAFLPLQ